MTEKNIEEKMRHIISDQKEKCDHAFIVYKWEEIIPAVNDSTVIGYNKYNQLVEMLCYRCGLVAHIKDLGWIKS